MSCIISMRGMFLRGRKFIFLARHVGQETEKDFKVELTSPSPKDGRKNVFTSSSHMFTKAKRRIRWYESFPYLFV